MASQFVEAVGFGVLNDVLAIFRSDAGHALPNRYEVIINPPSTQILSRGPGNRGLSRVASTGTLDKGRFVDISHPETLKQLTIKCESVNLPGVNIATADDTNIYGPIRQVAESVQFAGDITLVFQTSSDFRERKYFELWQERMFDKKTWNMNYYSNYIGSLEIYLLDKQSKRRYGLKCWEAYPKTIGASNLNYAPSNDIIKLSVDFSFRYWTDLDVKVQPTNIIGNIAETVIDTAERRFTGNIPRILNI